ncbi:MAG TPA: hypothetical protein VGB08_05645 [Allosphingosinicella sp.]|jgi:hypothetical protein
METLLTRIAIAGALLLALSQAGGEPALAQQSAGLARYAAIGRGADHVLLLDQHEGIIYHCPTEYEGRCLRRSHVEPERR